MGWVDEKQRVSVAGSQMAFVERGHGDPIVFLHGNPTSSYLWRNVLPHLEGEGRCIAPDLIGMGDSDKLEPSGPGRAVSSSSPCSSPTAAARSTHKAQISGKAVSMGEGAGRVLDG